MLNHMKHFRKPKKLEATTIKTNKSKAAKNNKLSKYSIDGIQFRTKIDFDAYTKGLEKAAFERFKRSLV